MSAEPAVSFEPTPIPAAVPLLDVEDLVVHYPIARGIAGAITRSAMSPGPMIPQRTIPSPAITPPPGRVQNVDAVL